MSASLPPGLSSILITGAAGFIGGQLAAHFRQSGAQVFVDAEPGPSSGTTRWPLSESSLLQVMNGNVPDVIFHAAGSGTVAKVAAHPTLELPANLGAFLAVLQYVRAHAPSAHVVLLSSAALYGDAPATPQAESEARPPVSLYGLAKAQAEQLAAYYARHMLVQASVVRLFSVYGQGLRKQLLWDAMRKFSRGELEFSGTGAERRDWVHISDVCRFMDHLLARADRPPFEIYNCAGSPATTSEVLSSLAQAVGTGPVRFNGITRPGDPAALIADCSKAHAELGWRAKIDWREGTRAYAQWFLKQPGSSAGSSL